MLPLIDVVDDVVKRLKKDFPDKSVAAYHSKISAEEKQSAEKKEVEEIRRFIVFIRTKTTKHLFCNNLRCNWFSTDQTSGKYAFFEDPNNTAYQIILMLLNKCKDLEGKTLIFVPLIDAVDDVVKRLKIRH